MENHGGNSNYAPKYSKLLHRCKVLIPCRVCHEPIQTKCMKAHMSTKHSGSIKVDRQCIWCLEYKWIGFADNQVNAHRLQCLQRLRDYIKSIDRRYRRRSYRLRKPADSPSPMTGCGGDDDDPDYIDSSLTGNSSVSSVPDVANSNSVSSVPEMWPDVDSLLDSKLPASESLIIQDHHVHQFQLEYLE